MGYVNYPSQYSGQVFPIFLGFYVTNDLFAYLTMERRGKRPLSQEVYYEEK